MHRSKILFCVGVFLLILPGAHASQSLSHKTSKSVSVCAIGSMIPSHVGKRVNVEGMGIDTAEHNHLIDPNCDGKSVEIDLPLPPFTPDQKASLTELYKAFDPSGRR